MSIFYEGPNFFASGKIVFGDLAENCCQELATLIIDWHSYASHYIS
jgi:hypothetical protein